MFQDPASYGYLGITIFLILTGCGLPLPEEVAIIAAGVAAARGGLDPWGRWLRVWSGAILGDSAMYLIGRRFGAAILEKHSFWARIFNPKREKQIEGLLNKHGAKMILLARFLVGLRSPFYFAAGVLRVNYLRFLITDICCAVSVISLFFGLTYFFGRQIWNGIHHAEVAITIAVVAAVLIGIVIFWFNRRGKVLLQEESEAESSTAHVDKGKSEVAGHKP